MTTTPRAIILAAGLGTRLGELSAERPKPMFPVVGYPLLRYAIALLHRHGITEIAINLHHKGDLIRKELGDGRAFGVAITYSEEPEILGTGGGLVKISDFLTRGGRDPFFVVNGKILIDVDLTRVFADHAARSAAATMVVRETPDAEKWGAIYLDEKDRVVGMLDRPPAFAHACMFTGVHVISPSLLARLPRSGESDSVRGAYQPALKAGDPIHAHRLQGYFHEHSTPARYLQGNWNVLDGLADRVIAPGPLSAVSPDARVAKDATLSRYVIVCPGAEVRSGAVLDRVVVWPGARAEGSHTNAIITPRGVFPV